MIIGAHKSIGKGLDGLIEAEKAIGANCVQLFVSPPRNWNPPKFSVEDLKKFGDNLKQNNLGPNFLHGIYLVNLGAENSEVRNKGIASVIGYLEAARAMQAQGVIIHSHKPDQNFISAIDEILDETSVGPLLIIENSAINTIEQTLAIFRSENSDRLGLCLDTCHLWAAGYDINNPTVIDEILSKIDSTIGLDRLKIIHCNDAKSKLNSKRDIHENLGNGQIGQEAFSILINHPKLQDVPFVLEVPGLDGNGPDKANIHFLKSLIK